MRTRLIASLTLALGCQPRTTDVPPTVAAEAAPVTSATVPPGEAPPAAPPAIGDAAALAAPLTALAVDLYQQRAAEPGNVALSSASVGFALGMAMAGARGETQAELARVLHVDGLDDPHAGLAGLGLVLSGEGDGWQLAAANRLWPAQRFALRPDFVALATDRYRAGVEALDFARSGAAAARINGWVGEHTAGKIRDLVSPDALDGRTRLVLTNALYLRASWQSPFDRRATRDGDFHPLSGGPIQARLMKQVGSFGLAAAAGAHAVELDYKGGELSYVAILPDDPAGFARFERSLDATLVTELLGKLERKRVALTLPVYQTTARLDLGRALVDLGARLAFSEGADFSGITAEVPGVFISRALHQTFVRVDEAGTEAAAATAVVMAVKAAVMPTAPPYAFTADRPFLYLIRHKPSGAILFLGRVVDPR